MRPSRARGWSGRPTMITSSQAISTLRHRARRERRLDAPDVQGPDLDLLADVGGGADLHLEVDPRSSSGECRQGPAQVGSRHGLAGTDTHRADLVGGGQPGELGHGLDAACHATAGGHHRPPHAREPKAASGSLKQPHPEGPLQGPELLRDRSSGQAQGLGSLGDALVLGHGQEGSQLLKGQRWALSLHHALRQVPARGRDRRRPGRVPPARSLGPPGGGDASARPAREDRGGASVR